MEPVAHRGYLGQTGGQIYPEETSMVAAEENYEGYEEYEGEDYYQEGLGAGAENRVGNTTIYLCMMSAVCCDDEEDLWVPRQLS